MNDKSARPPARWRSHLPDLRTGVAVGAIMLVPAITAWVSGHPFIFPSLGPSAYFLAATRERAHQLHQVIVGHLIGVIAGLACYWGIAGGVTIANARAPLSLADLRLIASGVLSVVVTTVAMKVVRTEHSPACATTLIISLGLLPSIEDAAFIMIAVFIMALGYRIFLHPRPLL